MSPERRIKHQRYGSGVVLKTRHNDFELYVIFSDGIKRWVRLDTLDEDSLQPSSRKKQVATSRKTRPGEDFKARRMVEAFRLGIVPWDCVGDFFFGREQESEFFMDWLHNNRESSLLLVGMYGAGKTHFLQYAINQAVDEGFAVANVEMDMNESTFFRPKRVFSRLVRTFKYRSPSDKKVKGFREFLKEALQYGVFKDHQYFNLLRGNLDSDEYWDWIEARESVIRPFDSGLPGMYDYATAANIYCYLLSALGWAAKNVHKLKGLLLVFDEAESMESGQYSYQIEKGRNFVKALMRTAANDQNLRDNIDECGLQYCRKTSITRKLPFIYRRQSGLKLLLAHTPTMALNWMHESKKASRLELQTLSDESLREVFEEIARLFDRAYDSINKDLTLHSAFQRIKPEDGHPRMLVKGSVEVLDLARFNSDRELSEILT